MIAMVVVFYQNVYDPVKSGQLLPKMPIIMFMMLMTVRMINYDHGVYFCYKGPLSCLDDGDDDVGVHDDDGDGENVEL